MNTGGSPDTVRLWAVRHGGVGDVTDSHVAWEVREDVPVESSPVLAGDLLFMVSDPGMVTCLDAKTGQKLWDQRLRGVYGTSPLYAEGRIYLSNKKGMTTVIQAGRAFRELAADQLDGQLWASPAVAGDPLLLRTNTHLYRIQNR